ncbi:MAG: cytochrome bd ubiquinol oxidase subunit [Myxococcales bacterium]|jgi:cytochrome d ubiquinol oxidase subunit II|nr:cytochrome bd ubiquinol oxidase subunit [Myxococcales bacterium]
MEMLWFWMVSVMVAIYVVMDGFDFGAGALHLIVAKTDSERRTVLAAIGPFWDGNEVWLLAAGGSLFLSFPRVLGAGFSGFYLAMFLVLWTLILRGCSVEFRSHITGPLWRAFWDVTFSVASLLMPVLLGAALGNVLRGVPITAAGTFELPLFTNFGISDPVGLLDWYTVLVGVFALATLTAHGALFLSWKADGPVGERSAALAPKLWVLVGGLWVVVAIATHQVNPGLFGAVPGRPLALFFTGVFLAGAASVAVGLARRRPFLSFLGSGAVILGLLAASAASVWPVMLPSTLNPAWSLTALNSASGTSTLQKGLGWWLLGFPIAVGYVLFLFRIHRGRVRSALDGEGY